MTTSIFIPNDMEQQFLKLRFYEKPTQEKVLAEVKRFATGRLMDLLVIEDPDMPKDEIHFKDQAGRIIARIKLEP